MPVKKAVKRTKSDTKPSLRQQKEKQNGLIFAVFILFICVAILSFVLYRVNSKQEQLITIANNLNNTLSKQQIVVTSDSDNMEPEVRYSESAVSGLRLAYSPCRPKFTGPCDDIMIYRLNADGSKEVIVPSVRNLAGAPLTNELLQPIAINMDSSRIAFGAWAYGGKQNTSDNRAWIVDTKTGKVIYQTENVPQEAIFSPDMAYAVYYSENEDAEGSLTLVDVVEDETKTLARASGGISYKDKDGNVTITWLDSSTVAVIQYEKDSETGELVISGEREITVN